MSKSEKPPLNVVPGPDKPRWPIPADLVDDFEAAEFYQRLCADAHAWHGSLGMPELSLIERAIDHWSAARQLSRFATEAVANGDPILVMKFRAGARSESQQYRSLLAALQLSGDRRGRGSKTARLDQAATAGTTPVNRWSK